MSVSVCCPRCQVTSVVPPELLGRSGRCNKCGRRIRLTSPVAELLEEPTELPPVEAELVLDALPDELEPIADLPSLEPASPPAPVSAPSRTPAPAPKRKPVDEDDWPDSPILLDDARTTPVAKPKRERPKPAPVRRGPSKVLLAVLALVGLLGGGLGGGLLLHYLTKPEPRNPEPDVVANDPPPPAPNPNPTPTPPAPAPPAPAPAPAPTPPVTPPNPNPNPNPKPKPPPPPLPPPPPMPEAKNTLKLPGVAVTMTAGGGGRYIIFQMADTGQLATFDAKAGRIVWTINGAKPEDLIAVSRNKLYIGKVKDARIARFDLATAAGDGTATLNDVGTTLKHLATGSSSDGPLVLVAHNGGKYYVRLYDPFTFGELAVPVADPTLPNVHNFPYTTPTLMPRVTVSADGRAMTMGTRYFMRTDEKYKGGLLTGAGIVFPAPDGRGFVGSAFYSADGARLPAPPRVGGFIHRYVPAAGGPFVVAAEYKTTNLAGMKLFLHLGTDPNPIGPLPGGELVGAWAKIDPGWTTKLHQRLIFVPDPGLLIFTPPGADVAHVLPVDIAALLKDAGRDPVFTSVPPAETRVGRAYLYRATLAGGRGAVAFSLESGPPGMQITKDGVLTWQVAEPVDLAYDVRIAARDADGRRAVQSFRLFVWKGAPAVVIAPKKPDPIELPKKVPAGAGWSVRLPAPAMDAVSGANGRLILLNLPATKQVAVFDVKEGKVVKFLPMEANAVITAGREHLFVVNNDAKTLQRWNLATFEKESTDKLPPGGPFSHAYMGANSIGPLLLCPKSGAVTPTKPLLVDALTLKAFPLEGPGDLPPEIKALARTVRVSADGQTFTWSPGRGARGAIVANISDGKAHWKSYPKAATPLTPGADGQSFYAYDGFYDSAVVRIYPTPDQPAHTGAMVPAAQGNLYLDVEPGPPIPNGLIAPQRANVFLLGHSKPIATIEGLNKPADGSPRFLHLAPQYGMFVMLSTAGTELLLHRFDLDAALLKPTPDFLVVLSDAPVQPVAGGRFEFMPIVKSKKGGVKMTLAVGPEGMTVADGRLTWAVPPDAAGREVSVLLTVSDASGQSVRQTFRLRVAAAAAVPVAPKAPMLPEAPAPHAPAAPGLPEAPSPHLPVAPPPRARDPLP